MMQQANNRTIGIALVGLFSISATAQTSKAPNVIFVLADEWRAHKTIYLRERFIGSLVAVRQSERSISAEQPREQQKI